MKILSPYDLFMLALMNHRAFKELRKDPIEKFPQPLERRIFLSFIGAEKLRIQQAIKALRASEEFSGATLAQLELAEDLIEDLQSHLSGFQGFVARE